MKTYPLYNPKRRIFAFEIENVYIGVKKIAVLLRSFAGVSNVRVRKLFSAPSDIHIEFIYKGQVFIVWEPYADSSRYWIGPKDEIHKQIDISALESAFRKYQPFFVVKVFGDLISLKFLKQKKRHPK